MNHDDFVRVMIHFRDKSGKRFPHGYFPGATGENLFNRHPEIRFSLKHNVAESRERWVAYQWDPPQFLQADQIYDWSNWNKHDVVRVSSEPEQDPLKQYAYKVARAKPRAPDQGFQVYIENGLVDFLGVPDGWLAEWPGKRCWMIQRYVKTVPAADAVTGVDADAFPKPTYDEMIEVLRTLSIQDEYWRVRMEHDHSTESQAAKRRAGGGALASALSGRIHVGDGVSHMVGLLGMLEDASAAGGRLPPIVLRDDAHNPKTIYLQSQLQELRREMIIRENMVQSAHNRVVKQVLDKWSEAEDESREWADRLDAINDYADLVENYEALLQAEMVKYDPDALPEDLATLQSLLTERLEALAMERLKFILHGESQQGVDLPASCDDQRAAMVSIAKLKQVWQIRIGREATREGALDAYNRARAHISAVVASNVPEWYQGRSKLASPAYGHSGAAVTLTARSPIAVTADDDRRTLITALGAAYADGIPASVRIETDSPAADPLSRQVTLALVTSETRPVKVHLVARNLCGPSELLLTLTPEAPS